MEVAELVLDYLRVLTSPILTFVIICIAIYTFKEPAKGILSKLDSMRLPGGTEFKTTQKDLIAQELMETIKSTGWTPLDPASTPQTKSTGEAPNQTGEWKRDRLAFQGRLVALEVGMRQLVAWSQNSNHDVKEGISNIYRHFRETPDQTAASIRQRYPDKYDSEMAETLVRHIAERLGSFLPIRLAGGASTGVSGSATVTVNKRDGSAAAE